jgi:predicted ribosomally synthesized peptide with SipW-like signal peptide
MISTFPALGLRGATGMRFMLLATLAAGMLSMNAGRGTLAYFTTQVASTANTFTAGTLRFTLDDNNESGTQAVTTSLTNVNIAPTKSAQDSLRINNSGTLDGKYGLAIATHQVGSDLDLSPALKLTVRAAAAGTFASCATDDITDNTKWTNIGVENVSLPANGAAASTLIDVTGGSARPLPVTGGTEVLCAKVNFPDSGSNSDDTYNSQNPAVHYSTNVDFTFDGRVS